LILVLKLAFKSLWNRRFASILTIASISLSVALLLGVERVRLGARSGFTNTISQTDLIVGARGAAVPLLLSTVFHIGNATNSIPYAAYAAIKARPEVAWTIPLSLGDSHKGFRVIGTTEDFYRHYHYRRDLQPRLTLGHTPQALFDVVIGSAVAAALGYHLGDRVTLAHGVGEVSFHNHGDKPFSICGVLAATGTPIDRSLFISLEGAEAIHADWSDGAPPLPGRGTLAAELIAHPPKVDEVTAFFVATKARGETLALQRQINETQSVALTAIIPGVTLNELWDLLVYAENALRLVSTAVVFVGLLGMLVSLYNSLNERRREMAILRAIGAGPGLIFSLMIFESGLLTLVGAASGACLVYLLLAVGQPVVEAQLGLFIPLQVPSLAEAGYFVAVLGFGVILGAIPAWRAYRSSLCDGLTMRL